MKKTIFVIYTNNATEDALKNRNMKRYAFNTDSEVKVGDVVNSKEYDSKMIVVEVLTKEYKYYDRTSGMLSNELISTGMFEIKEMKIVDGTESEVVIATRNGSIA